MIGAAALLAGAGAVVWWQIGPDWREHILAITFDILTGRYQ